LRFFAAPAAGGAAGGDALKRVRMTSPAMTRLPGYKENTFAASQVKRYPPVPTDPVSATADQFPPLPLLATPPPDTQAPKTSSKFANWIPRKQETRFVIERRAYRRELTLWRKRYMQEYQDGLAKKAEAKRQQEEALQAQREERKKLRAERFRLAVIEQEKVTAKLRAQKAARRAYHALMREHMEREISREKQYALSYLKAEKERHWVTEPLQITHDLFSTVSQPTGFSLDTPHVRFRQSSEEALARQLHLFDPEKLFQHELRLHKEQQERERQELQQLAQQQQQYEQTKQEQQQQQQQQEQEEPPQPHSV